MKSLKRTCFFPTDVQWHLCQWSFAWTKQKISHSNIQVAKIFPKGPNYRGTILSCTSQCKIRYKLHTIEKAYKTNCKVSNKCRGLRFFSYLQTNKLACFHFLDASSMVSSMSTISIFVWVPHSPGPTGAMQRDPVDTLCLSCTFALQPGNTGLGEIHIFLEQASYLFRRRYHLIPQGSSLQTKPWDRAQVKSDLGLAFLARERTSTMALGCDGQHLPTTACPERKQLSILPREADSKRSCPKFCFQEYFPSPLSFRG